MEFLFPVLLSIHILVGLGVIGLVLLQHGKGADMGAAFGSGASGSLFGASGSANFLSRTTAILAAVFFFTSLGLSYVSGSKPKAPESVMEAPLGVPPGGGAVTVPLPSGPSSDIPAPSEKAVAPAVDQKPVVEGEGKPAVGDKPAAASESKGAAVPDKGASPAADGKAQAEGAATQKDEAAAEAKAGAKPGDKKPADNATPTAPAKGEKDAAAKKSGTEKPASESKAKDIPK